jgi:branched-chain amino acid transport system permease protein
MSYPGKIRIERWTELSRAVAIVAIVVIVALALAPLLAPANVVDRLTTLFIYIILAVMWNALAGYGGLVSIGQQAFFGAAAYFSIRLSDAGVSVFPALIVAILLVGILAIPMSSLMLRLRAGEFAVGMWVGSELLRLLVNLDPLIQGDTGRSLIALSAFDPDTRRSAVYWLALVLLLLLIGAVFVLLRSKQGAAIQAIRDNEEAAASLGVRVRRAKQVIFVLAAVGCGAAGVLWLATSTTFQPRSFFGVQWTAYMIFMVLVGGLGRFEGPILGAIIFFLIESWFGATGVWYLIGLGLTALVFALFLPRGIWGTIEDTFQLQLLPVGYKVRILDRDEGAPHGRAVAEPETSEIQDA